MLACTTGWKLLQSFYANVSMNTRINPLIQNDEGDLTVLFNHAFKDKPRTQISHDAVAGYVDCVRAVGLCCTNAYSLGGNFGILGKERK